MNKKILATILLAASVNASASEWYVIGTGGGEYYFIDRESADREGHIVNLWSKVIATKASISNSGAWMVNERHRVNCKTKTIQSLSITLYDEKEKLMASNNDAKKEVYVPPDSIGETEVRIVCMPSFPKTVEGHNVFRVPDNDPKTFAAKFSQYLAEKEADKKRLDDSIRSQPSR